MTAPVALPDRGWRRLLRQFKRFFGVGVLAALVHYGLLIYLVEWRKMDPLLSTMAGYLAGGVLSYILNRLLTYDAERGHLDAGWRFAVVALIGLGVTTLLMAVFLRVLDWHYIPSQVLTTGIVLLWSFFAHKYWSFRDRG
jgi:putative flippase GtrA